MATFRNQRGEESTPSGGDLCGYKRSATSTRPPCLRAKGHEGTHSYDERRRGA